MSDMSYPIKENTKFKIVQGGEKKVMKKILSVALSTAMAFSMFASVAFGETAISADAQYAALAAKGILNGFPDGQAHLEKDLTRAEFAKIVAKLFDLSEVTTTLTYKDKNYNASHWARGYIEAVTKAGLMNGQSATLFNPSGKVTVQEVATVLARALKLELPTATNNTATEWAKQYVQAVIDKGLLASSINFQGNATRELVVKAAYAIDVQQTIPQITKTEVVDASNLKVTLSNGTVADVKLATPLVANTATEVTFTIGGIEYKTTVTYVVTSATKVASVTATNLKEVTVAFDGEVDAATAEDESNYSINKSITVTAAALSADKKTVTLTVQGSSTDVGLTNQVEYELDVNNVRAGATVINAADVKFTPVDAALPVAVSAEALGNKAIKITFSEPVVASTITANNFKLDGISVVGTIDVSGRVVVVKLYSTLTNGEHTVNIAGVKDFSGLANLSTDLKVNVVEDKVAPTVAVEKATFEEVTLKFSEAVDKTTVTAGNIYWLESSTKRYATSVEAISDDTYKVKFSAYPLKYATSLYVTNVTDYSGNAIAANTAIPVNPVIDQTRPEVVSVKFIDNSSTDFDVKFTKSLTESTAENTANYVIKKADGTVVSQFKTATLTDAKTVRIHLYAALSAGTAYTLEISNVADDTTLKNVMLPYSTTITLGDVTPPSLQSASLSATAHRLVVNYNEAMATSGTGSILDKANYIYYKNGTYTPESGGVPASFTGGVWTALPGDASIIASSDSKSAIIIFANDFDLTTVKGVRVTSVKDVAGNTLSGLVAETPVSAALAVTANSAKATATNKIDVVFNQTIQSNSATPNDFVVTAGGVTLSVIAASVDGSTVTLTLANDLTTDAKSNGNSVNVQVLADRNIVTPSGTKVATAISKPVDDGIKPTIQALSSVINGVAKVTFTEKIAYTANVQYDFDVLANDTTLKLTDDYTVTQNGDNGVNITLTPSALNTHKGEVLNVRIKQLPQFIFDQATTPNVVAGGSSYFSAFIPTDYTAPTASVNAATSTASSLALNLSEPATVSIVTGGTADGFNTVTPGAGNTTATITGDTAADGETLQFTVTDADNNVTAYTATYDAVTGWSL